MTTTTTRLTGWRKIASALWDAPDDPQVYGALDVDATALLAFVRDARAHGVHVTPTHLVGRAVAHALVAVPELNVRLVGDRSVPHPTIDVFFITSVGKGHDLSGVKVVSVDRMAAVHLARDLDERGRRLKEGIDPAFLRTKRTMDRLPRLLLRPVLRAGAWLAGEHGLAVPLLGVEASPFGSAMVTSVGMLGLPMGFAPLVWMYRVPLLVLAGEIVDRAVVVDGEVVVRPMLPITATIDHRYVDGAQLGHALRAFRRYLEAPAAFEPAFNGATRHAG